MDAENIDIDVPGAGTLSASYWPVARPACCRSVIWVSSDAWEGVSSAQVGLLFLLTSRSEAAVGEIAEALQVAPAAVTNLSKRTQAGGLIERVADADDGRLTRLRLTPAGKAASAQSSVLLHRLNRQLTGGFSPDELAVVTRWLEHAGQLPGQAPAGD